MVVMLTLTRNSGRISMIFMPFVVAVNATASWYTLSRFGCYLMAITGTAPLILLFSLMKTPDLRSRRDSSRVPIISVLKTRAPLIRGLQYP